MPTSPLLFFDASKPVTVEDILLLLGIVALVGLAYWIFSPKKVPWEEPATTRRAGATPTPVSSRWFARLFESEGEPSIRLVLAAITTVFALVMVAIARLNEMQLESLLTFVGSLLLIGSARLAAKAWAARPPAPDTQIKTDNAAVTGENVTVNTDANATTTA